MLAFLCIAAFAGVGRNGFINLDDPEYITANPMVARGLTAQGFTWAFTTTRAANWHPLTWLSHMLDVQLLGMHPGRQHLMSLALHTGSALLLFALLNATTGMAWRSFFAAALFAVHPLRVESVAWASERKDVLAMIFTLLTMLTYVRGLRRSDAGRHLAPATFFTLALLAKPMPVTLPFLLLLLDWWPLGRWTPRRDRATGSRPANLGALPPAALFLEKAPLFLLAAASSAATLFAQSSGGAAVPDGTIPLAARAANAVVSYGAYLVATLYPFRLAVFYPHPTGLPPWPSWTASFLALCAATAAFWRLRHRRPWLPVGWLWFLGGLLPMIGLVQVGWQSRADRYTYLPHIGISLLAVWGLASASSGPRVRRALAAAGIVLVLSWAAATASQVAHWRTSIDLFSHAATLVLRPPQGGGQQESPTLAFIHNSLGLAYFNEGRLAAAISQYRSALALNPADAVVMNNLAKALEKSGRAAEARALYSRAILDPFIAEPRNNLGTMLMGEGRLDDAIRLFREAASIDPINASSHINLGTALAIKGKAAEAETALRTGIALAPEYEPARFNLGKFFLEQRRYGEAIKQLEESVRLEPEQAAAHFLLGQAKERAGEYVQAERAYRRAVALDPSLRASLPGMQDQSPVGGPGRPGGR